MYSPEQRTEIYEAVCHGVMLNKSLRAIVAENSEAASEQGKKFPTYSTIIEWLAADRDFSIQYARAKERQADLLAEEVTEIADAPVITLPDNMEEAVKLEATRLDMERRRMMIDARKWRAGHLRPKVYGNRAIIQGDSEADPIRTEGSLADKDKIDLARWVASQLMQGVDAEAAPVALESE